MLNRIVLFLLYTSTQFYCTIANSEVKKKYQEKDTVIEIIKSEINSISYNDPVKIYDLCQKGIMESKRRGNNSNEAWFLIKLANMHYTNYNIEKATELYYEAFNCLDTTMIRDIVPLYIAFGNVSIENEVKIDYYKKALKIYSDLNDTIGQIRSLLNIGNVQLNAKNNKESYSLFHKAFTLANKKNATEELGLAYQFLAIYYEKEVNFEKSILYYNKAIGCFSKTNNLWRISALMNSLGSIYLDMGDYKESVRYLNQSKKYAIKNGYKDILSYSYYKLSKAWTNTNYDSAYYYCNLRNELEYKIKEKVGYDKLKLIQAQHNAENKANEIIILEQKKNIKNLYIIILTVFLVSMMMIIHLQRMSFRKKKALEKKEREIIRNEHSLLEAKLQNEKNKRDMLINELDFKNNKLSSLALHFFNKNELLNDLKNKISRLVKSQDDDIKRNLQEIKKWFNVKIDIESDRRELNIYINEEYHEFSFKLKRHFPELTNDEVKLCIYIILELSSKEIALIYNIIPRSVITKRYRLRKKFGLESEDDLLLFLKKFQLDNAF